MRGWAGLQFHVSSNGRAPGKESSAFRHAFYPLEEFSIRRIYLEMMKVALDWISIPSA